MSTQYASPAGFPAFGSLAAPGVAPYGSLAAPVAGAPGGTFYNTVQHPDGNVVDQYIVPGETMHVPEPVQVPGVTTVMENQTYMEPKQVTVKVPRTIMEPVEISYQVPAYETRTHTAQRPKVVMEEQMITVQEPRTVMEPVAIQVPQVQTVQAVQVHQKIVEYERPRMIPGKLIRTVAGPTQTIGVTGAAPVATTTALPVATTVPTYGSYVQPTAGFVSHGYAAAPGMVYGSVPMYGAQLTSASAGPAGIAAPHF